MGAIFGKSKKPAAIESRVTEQDKAVLELKKQRDQLKQYQKNIIATLEKERELAKKLLHDGKKDRAKLLLKKKRFQEAMLDKSEKQLDNIDEMCHSLEFAQIEMKVVDGLKLGNEALKKVHDMMSVEEVERILEETREGVEKQAEIDAILSGSLSPEDLEEVESELERILEEENLEMKKDVLISPAESEAPSLPDVPETPLPQIQDEKEQLGKKERVAVAAS